MGILKEFKAFAMRGNVMDMAVGIIIGAAFGKIVNSLVNDIIMPPLGMVLGKMDFSNMAIVLKPAVIDEVTKAVVTPAVTVGYGMFINAIINFVIVAFAIFMLVKGMNRLYKKEQPAPAAPPTLSKQEQLLTDIKEILARKS